MYPHRNGNTLSSRKGDVGGAIKIIGDAVIPVVDVTGWDIFGIQLKKILASPRLSQLLGDYDVYLLIFLRLFR